MLRLNATPYDPDDSNVRRVKTIGAKRFTLYNILWLIPRGQIHAGLTRHRRKTQPWARVRRSYAEEIANHARAVDVLYIQKRL